MCSSDLAIVAVPRNLTVPVPDAVPLEAAAFVTLGAIAEEALRRCAISFGETVVLYGLGLLGLPRGRSPPPRATTSSGSMWTSGASRSRASWA